MRSDAALEQAARALRLFLENNKTERWLSFPGAGTFPQNAYDATSNLLAFVFEEKFGRDDVVVVEGYDHASDDRHFRVEVGGKIYDLTADQFDGFDPIFGAACASLSSLFPQREQVEERRWVGREDAQACCRSGLS